MWRNSDEGMQESLQPRRSVRRLPYLPEHMFPPRLRRLLDDLVDAADVVLAYEAPPVEPVREVRENGLGSDRHTLRRAARTAPPERRPGAAPAPNGVCVTPRR